MLKQNHSSSLEDLRTDWFNHKVKESILSFTEELQIDYKGKNYQHDHHYHEAHKWDNAKIHSAK